MNVSLRRFGLLPMVCAAALSVVLPQALRAQSNPDQAAGQLKTVAVVAGANYQKLIDDLSFLGSLGGQPQAGQMADASFNLFTQGKGAKLLDKSKPWGVIVQTDGAGFPFVLVLPVSKVDDVLQIAKGFGGDVKQAQNGVNQVEMPGGKTFYLKPQGEVLFISTAAASLNRLPSDPLSILTKRVGEYDLAVALKVQNVPEMYKAHATDALQAGLERNMKQLPNETDEQYADRQKMVGAQLEQMKRVINETDTVSLSWGIDKDQKRTFLDFALQFVAGSELARGAATFKSESNFAGFHQPDAAFTSLVSLQADPNAAAGDMAQIESGIQKAREQIHRQIDKNEKLSADRETYKAAADDIIDALAATVKEARLDGGAAVRLGAGTTSIVAGMHVKDPSKIESALKKLEPVAKKEKDFPGIKWNAANHAGVTFHTISGPLSDSGKEKELREMFGETMELSVGIGPDAVYLAMGHDSLNAINKAIDASAAEKGKKVSPFDMSISLQPIMEIAALKSKGPEAEVNRKIADMLKNQAHGRDHFLVQSQVIPNGMKYHVEAEEGVLRAIGMGAAEAQKRKMQAAGQ